MSTRSELRTQLKDEIKKDPNGKIWSNDVLDRFINQGYFKFQKDGNFQWRENEGNTTFTLTWVQEYAIPTDYGKTNLVRYNGTTLYKTSKLRLKREYTSFVWGTPSKYYTYGAFIGFDVIPNVSGTIDWDYQKINKLAAADGTESDYDTDFDNAIVLYATFRAFSTIPELAGVARAKFQEYEIERDNLYSSYIFDDTSDLHFTVPRGRSFTRDNVLDR